jgi:hypothetical protein
MIVPAMSEIEIQNELSNDYESCITRVQKDMNKYRRGIIKASKFPIYFKPIEHTSPSRNNFIIYVNAKSKKDAFMPFVTIVGYYHRPEGIYAAMIFPVAGEKFNMLIYPPHFFKRYKERYIKEDLNSLEVIKTFFRNNPTYMLQAVEKENFRGSCIQGFVFGKFLNPTISIVKTFISCDMLKGEQTSLNDILLNELNDYSESTKKPNVSIKSFNNRLLRA